MNLPTAVQHWRQRRRERGHRRLIRMAEWQLSARTADPHVRAHLISTWAVVEESRALSPAPRTARECRAVAELLRTVAAGERSLLDGEWTPACDLRVGVDVVWHRGAWLTVHAVHFLPSAVASQPSMYEVELPGPGPNPLYRADQPVRTGGPDPDVPDQVHVAYWRDRMTATEYQLWTELAATRDRPARAGLLAQIAPLAAKRTAVQAVGDALELLARAERAAHRRATPRQPSSRAGRFG